MANFTSPAKVLIIGSLYLAGEALRINRQLPD
jgi:folylpolyglutamate synthase/dihydropteroate synthase